MTSGRNDGLRRILAAGLCLALATGMAGCARGGDESEGSDAQEETTQPGGEISIGGGGGTSSSSSSGEEDVDFDGLWILDSVLNDDGSTYRESDGVDFLAKKERVPYYMTISGSDVHISVGDLQVEATGTANGSTMALEVTSNPTDAVNIGDLTWDPETNLLSLYIDQYGGLDDDGNETTNVNYFAFRRNEDENVTVETLIAEYANAPLMDGLNVTDIIPLGQLIADDGVATIQLTGSGLDMSDEEWPSIYYQFSVTNKTATDFIVISDGGTETQFVAYDEDLGEDVSYVGYMVERVAAGQTQTLYMEFSNDLNLQPGQIPDVTGNIEIDDEAGNVLATYPLSIPSQAAAATVATDAAATDVAVPVDGTATDAAAGGTEVSL